jgi:peptidoglycan/LPS O-acetylase OafA/YrhL
VAIPFGALILVFALGRGFFARVLRWSPFVLLGEISYSVYLLHFSLLMALTIWEWPKSVSPWVIYIGAWAVTLILSYLAWRFVETPARRYLVSLAGRAATQPTIAPAKEVRVGA